MSHQIKNIGVFFGSRSPEHDVSIITAQLIISELKKSGYTVIPVYLSKQGKWMIGDELSSLKTFINSENIQKLKSLEEYYIDLENSFGKLVFKKKGLLSKSEITIDLAFPAFHGSYGEDGTMQGLFEILNIPFVGCDTAASAIAMDKVMTKYVIQANGVPTPAFTVVEKTDWKSDKSKVLNDINLNYPLFVKPPRLGSSIGIQKVNSKEELEMAIEVALHYDTKALVEEGVENLMDVTCCVIGNQEPIASVLQESVFESDLFDFTTKYITEGGAQLGSSVNGLQIPARLDEKTTKEIQEVAKKVFKVLGCSGISRVDFLYNKQTKKYFVSEVNPLPGTIYHHLWKASGVELNELIGKLISYAIEKYDYKNTLTYTFESDILNQLKGSKLGGSKLSS